MEATSEALSFPQPQATAARSASLPWVVYLAVAGLACQPIGMLWDISYHSTMGRDTLWTPAHIIIQLGGTVPALLLTRFRIGMRCPSELPATRSRSQWLSRQHSNELA
jgi:hypothetical protein